MSISDLRQSYDDAPRFDLHDLEPDPVEQFHKWFRQAVEADIKEPNAMTLASVDPAGDPDARIVLLKEVDERGFTFYTNYTSAKAMQIAQHPRVTLVFYWDVLYRSVRVRGPITKVGRDEAQAYWNTRPRASQLGAIASPQSAELTDRTQLEEAFGKAAEQLGNLDAIPLPDHWGGYRVAHEEIEFWQGQRSRLHDRLVYVKREDGGWRVKRLAP
ncbi:MAG: pyridoxamine 5'-phosphate oxidase [Planctomycetota bacterium]